MREVILKTDAANAFNYIKRNKMLKKRILCFTRIHSNPIPLLVTSTFMVILCKAQSLSLWKYIEKFEETSSQVG